MNSLTQQNFLTIDQLIKKLLFIGYNIINRVQTIYHISIIYRTVRVQISLNYLP